MDDKGSARLMRWQMCFNRHVLQKSSALHQHTRTLLKFTSFYKLIYMFRRGSMASTATMKKRCQVMLGPKTGQQTDYFLNTFDIYWLVVWNINFRTFHIVGIIWNVIIPTDELIFFRGIETTNQYNMVWFVWSSAAVARVCNISIAFRGNCPAHTLFSCFSETHSSPNLWHYVRSAPHLFRWGFVKPGFVRRKVSFLGGPKKTEGICLSSCRCMWHLCWGTDTSWSC